jgi:hypothetical protein
MIRHFDCESCGAHGKITFKETNEYSSSDLAYCPFCGGDISELEDDYEEDDESPKG